MNWNLVEHAKRLMTNFGASWVMWLLLGLSIVAVAEAKRLLENSPSAEAAVVVAGLVEADRGPQAAEEAMAGAAALQRMKLEKRLAFLGTLGNNAPFVGL